MSIRGKIWKQESVISILSPPIKTSDADYMLSKTTKERGNGAVLLFTAFQLLEEDEEKDKINIKGKFNKVEYYKLLKHL